MKFEYIFAYIVTLILAAALFISMLILKNENITITILTVFVGALSGVTSYFFTKHVPKPKEEQLADTQTTKETDS